MQIRQLERGDETVAVEASRLFGAVGDLDPVALLARAETVLMICHDGVGIAGWVCGHEFVHPDGKRTMVGTHWTWSNAPVDAASERRSSLPSSIALERTVAPKRG
jgi:hypothetical protein